MTNLSNAKDLWLPGLRMVVRNKGVEVDMVEGEDGLWLQKESGGRAILVFRESEQKPDWPTMRRRFESAIDGLK